MRRKAKKRQMRKNGIARADRREAAQIKRRERTFLAGTAKKRRRGAKKAKKSKKLKNGKNREGAK